MCPQGSPVWASTHGAAVRSCGMGWSGDGARVRGLCCSDSSDLSFGIGKDVKLHQVSVAVAGMGMCDDNKTIEVI